MNKILKAMKTGVVLSLATIMMVACSDEKAIEEPEPDPEVVEQVVEKEEPKKEEPKKEEPKKEEPKVPTALEEIQVYSPIYSTDVLPYMTETFNILGLVANEIVANPIYAGSQGFYTDMVYTLDLTHTVEDTLSMLTPQSPEVKKINDLLEESNLVTRESILLIEKGVEENNPEYIIQASGKMEDASSLINEATLILEEITSSL